MRIKAKYIIYVGAFIVLTIIGIFSVPKNEEIIINNKSINSGDITSKEDVIYVHIIGAINEPGIKEVPKYTRLFELIELSGGTKENADISKLNLASILKDEQKIVIPEFIDESIQNNIVETKTNNTTISKSSSLNSQININYASKEELINLPGIGTSMAQRIIDYRENVALFDIEDIKNVSRHRRCKI